MQVWLLDYETFCKVNHVPQVTNPVMFDSGNVPTVDGLFSTELFGTSTRERKETFGYIDLGMYFINPKAYITLKRLNRNFESVIYGSKKFTIQNGELVLDEENGKTGIKWLYDNWDSIKFPKNESKIREERVDLLSLNKRDIIFTKKFLVLPAFYRDVNLQSTEDNPKVPEINDLYAKILRNVKMIQDSVNLESMISALTGKVQDLMVDVYNLIKEKIQGKSGYIRKYLMGKSVDYCSRVVITAAPYISNSAEEQTVDFYHTGVPLSHVCSMFTPFIIFWLQRWFKNNVENQKNSFQVINDKGEITVVKIKNPEAYFNEEYIEKHLASFVKNPYTRFDTIEVPIDPEQLKKAGLKKNPTLKFVGYKFSPNDIATAPKTENEIHRDLTWTDLLYMAAIDMTADKHVRLTRYPMLDYLGSYVTRITVISTRLTTPMVVNGTLYKEYPVIDLSIKKPDMDAMFRDTVNICAVYLPALGGDHDGEAIQQIAA